VSVLLAVILALPFRIDAGPYTGAYRLDRSGAVNWYFATTALLRLPRLPLPETRAYLDAYLAHLDPNGGIADALPMPTGIFAPIAPDSEDAYAGTLLSLAARYREESHDDVWWRESVGTLEAVAYSKLLVRIKPDGLVRASATDATGYLMDNVEDYAGLRAFAAALRATHGRDAEYVHEFVAPLGTAIDHLYDERAHAYRWSDSDPLGAMVPYPACAAQVYTQLFDVRSGDRALDRRHRAGARAAAAGCHFSPATSPHEALLYALYIATLPDASRGERAFEREASSARYPSDLITISLLDALHADASDSLRTSCQKAFGRSSRGNHTASCRRLLRFPKTFRRTAAYARSLRRIVRIGVFPSRAPARSRRSPPCCSSSSRSSCWRSGAWTG